MAHSARALTLTPLAMSASVPSGPSGAPPASPASTSPRSSVPSAYALVAHNPVLAFGGAWLSMMGASGAYLYSRKLPFQLKVRASGGAMESASGSGFPRGRVGLIGASCRGGSAEQGCRRVY